ncbi:DNA polymerase zeta catalytic subunit-like [Centruroides sculpturatus]|uniref:DNA polymerase zeta catalytic subunit-like n=1 Tax=Centruroides sculpturatus TaxID=218467 RepID=UPI000C6DA6D1|nr:DNA polymerase zeta catalytic subunit-like [Centruroides sculpturatus]
MFSLRIVTVDHYLSTPLEGLDVSYSDFRGCEIKHVPVIRIFGTTPKGKKACLHVHGVFPYISIPFDGGGYERPEKFIQQLALSIDKALNVANGNYSHVQHVYKISLLAGIPFYGYHEKDQRFLRIFFYNPVDVKRTVELLQNGTIMNQIMQPHEAHIPYILQFFIDYNLYGMDMINICEVKFRKNLNGNSQNSVSQSWNTSDLDREMLTGNMQRQSSCELEVDCCAKDILNKREETDTPSMNPGLAVMWEEERQRQENNGKTLQLTPPASNERDKVEPTESEIFYLNRLKSIIRQISESSEAVEDSSKFEEITDKELVSSLTPASVVEIHTPEAKG